MPKINQLTPKMVRFCEGIVSGMPYKEAYISAYNTENMNDKTIITEALKLTKRDDITNYIQELRKPLLNHELNAQIGESERIKQCLWDIINNPEEKTENQIRAMDILNRMNKAYSDSNADQKQETELSNIDSTQLMELIKVS
jgi:hypothetical protein